MGEDDLDGLKTDEVANQGLKRRAGRAITDMAASDSKYEYGKGACKDGEGSDASSAKREP